MNRRDKLKNAISNDEELTESTLKQLVEEFSIDDSSELLGTLCDMKSQFDGRCYALYKITVILKYLCDKNPEKYSNSLLERASVLGSLTKYVYIDDFGRDQGSNVRINAEQLLDYLEANKLDNLGIIDVIEASLNAASEQLLQTVNAINNINSEKILQKLRSDIARLSKYLAGPVTFEKHAGLDRNPRIDGTIYGKIVEKVVDNFDDRFPTIDDQLDPIIERFIVVRGSTFSMLYENLVVLTDALKRSTDAKVTDTLVDILEKLIKSDSLLSAMTDICKIEDKTSIEREETEREWRKMLQIIVSLPNRIANKLDGKIPNAFSPNNYAKIMTFQILRSMSFVNSTRKTAEHDARMISMLISKAFTTLGHEKFEYFVDIISEWCLENADIRDLTRNILSHVDRSAMEHVAVLFFERNDPALEIGKLFPHLSSNPHWKYVFTIKIPLMSYYESENLANNLIGYLWKYSRDERVSTDLVVKLLDIWGDRSALNHTPLEQHVYITKLIILSMRTLRGKLATKEKDEIKRLLFSGTSAHLESTQSELRGVGMTTGEILVEMLNETEDEPRLKYDYEGMPDKTREIVDKLRNLANIDRRSKSSDEGEHSSRISDAKSRIVQEKKIYELAIACGILSRKIAESERPSKIIRPKSSGGAEKSSVIIDRPSTQDSDDNLDSDDDLAPYDMSNDTPIAEKLRPAYLRDLRDNLLNAQTDVDPDIFSESMKCSEKLILSQLPNDDSSFAIELLEIFVTLREKSYLQDFQLFKFKACVSIVTVYPKDSALYLCKEFHEKIGEYSTKDRIFILEILGESARRLSKIEATSNSPKDPKDAGARGRKYGGKKISLAVEATCGKKYETLYDEEDFEVSPADEESAEDWRDVVSERINRNTRRFARPTKLATTTANKFNDVASSFFFPLLGGFRREGTRTRDTSETFRDQENILLVNYLKTLSRITMAAENCVVAPRIAREIMDLAWTLRYHDQAKVRLCVIENVASAVIVAPKAGLTADLMESIVEFRAWLSDVSDDGVRGDPDYECRNLGKNVVALIDSMFRSTLNEF